MNKNILNKIGTVIEIGCITALGVIAIKSECRRHKAMMALTDAKIALDLNTITDEMYKIQIEHLEKELEELKSEKEESQ